MVKGAVQSKVQVFVFATAEVPLEVCATHERPGKYPLCSCTSVFDGEIEKVPNVGLDAEAVAETAVT
jgi:hypothetical protein